MNPLKAFQRFPANLFQMLVINLPGDLGYALRFVYWKKKLRYMGSNVRIDTGVYFQNPEYIELEAGCWIDRNVTILAGVDNSKREKIAKRNNTYPGAPGVVHVGKSVHVGPDCILSGISAGIYISDFCGLSAGCKLYAFSHHFRSKLNPSDPTFHFGPLIADEKQCIIEGPIFLGCNTGVALNAVILPGVSVPDNCFVAINSVVYPGCYQNNSVLSGNPAKEVSARFKLGD